MSNVTGGTPGYAVTWTGPEGVVGDAWPLMGWCRGCIPGAVLDANGCFAATTVEVEALLPLTLSVTAGPWTARLERGPSFWTPMAAPRHWKWPLVSDGGTPELISGSVMLSPGSHVIGVIDARGCSVDTTLVLNPPVDLALTVDPAGCGAWVRWWRRPQEVGRVCLEFEPRCDRGRDVGCGGNVDRAGSRLLCRDCGRWRVQRDAERRGGGR